MEHRHIFIPVVPAAKLKRLVSEYIPLCTVLLSRDSDDAGDHMPVPCSGDPGGTVRQADAHGRVGASEIQYQRKRCLQNRAEPDIKKRDPDPFCISGFRCRVIHIAVIQVFRYLFSRKVQDGILTFLKFGNRHFPAFKQIKTVFPFPDIKAGADLILLIHQQQIAFIKSAVRLNPVTVQLVESKSVI